MKAVEVENLSRIYSSGRGIKGISLVVEEGESFGLVGPNGAGKTTLIEIIEGVRKPEEGQSVVFGIPSSDPKVKSFFGVQLQEHVPFFRLRVEEILFLVCQVYETSFSPFELMDLLGLLSRRRAFYEHLSGGEKQRLRLALALAGRPKLLFLDEPTTGLDPHCRRELWEVLRKLKNAFGTTIFLTSHYMEEVEVLCDRVGVLFEGKLVAIGTPTEIVSRYGNVVYVRMVVADEAMLEKISSLSSVKETKEKHGQEGVFRIESRELFLQEVGILIGREGWRIYDLEFDSGSLEDAVLSLTAGGKR